PKVMFNYDRKCPGFSIFNITYSEEVIEVFWQIDDVAYIAYNNVMLYFSPFAIVANILSACVLLTKELRNPFNFLMSLMCIEVVIPLLIRMSLEYRSNSLECSVETMTYSLALHSLIAIVSWTPF
ncbi:hypothetical protein PMAYCL1PPCAC_01107, partial [Pristionchus mayeri]